MNPKVYLTSNEEKRRNFGDVMIRNVLFNLFSSSVGLPLHNTPFPGVLINSIGGSLLQPDALFSINHMRTSFLL